MLGPIFAREFLTLPRQARHYSLRTVYLGLLWVLALTVFQAFVGWDQTATLGDNGRFGQLLFQVLTYVQLTLVLFFAALSAASAVTLEKDRRTFILLLMTDLRNYEIVLGKCLGSLLQIVLLLLATLPLLSLLLLLGGIDFNQVLQALAVMLGTALAAGSLGTLIALWRDKTFQALALTVLVIVLYLCLVHALAILPALASDFVARATIDTAQQYLQPFLALQSVLAWQPDKDALAPAYGFALAMLGLSALLNLVGVWRLRVWNPSGEPVMQRERPDDEMIDRAKAHAAPGALRQVWANPILWREIATRAYGRRPMLVKLAYFLVLALVCYYALGTSGGSGQQRAWAAAYGLVPIGVLSLLLICAQAVTAITGERDLGALDLLLVTDLSPHEFIFGKLLGILYNTKEFLLPPLLLLGYYGWLGWLAAPPTPGRNLAAGLCLAIAILVLMAFTVILGIHVALRAPTSRFAIINGLGTVFFLSVGTLICIFLIVINGRFEYQWLSFIFFLVAGIGGMWWVLAGDRPSTALSCAAFACPPAVFYTVTNILIGKPGTPESTDPALPFLVTTGAFGFAIAAMLVPLLSEFDTALGRTTGTGE